MENSRMPTSNSEVPETVKDEEVTPAPKSNRSAKTSDKSAPATKRSGRARSGKSRTRDRAKKPDRELMILNFKPGENDDIRRQSPTAIQVTPEDFPEIADCYGITNTDGMIPIVSMGEGTQLFDKRLYEYLESSADIQDSTGDGIFELFISCAEVISDTADISQVRNAALNRAIRSCYRIDILEQWLQDEQVGSRRAQVLGELDTRLTDLKNPKDSQTAGINKLKQGIY
jgi:hypothetical protein